MCPGCKWHFRNVADKSDKLTAENLARGVEARSATDAVCVKVGAGDFGCAVDVATVAKAGILALLDA